MKQDSLGMKAKRGCSLCWDQQIPQGVPEHSYIPQLILSGGQRAAFCTPSQPLTGHWLQPGMGGRVTCQVKKLL